MNSFQLQVQKVLTVIIFWLSYLTIFGFAGLDPSNAQAELGKEIPAQQKTTIYETELPNTPQNISNPNEDKINAPEVDTIIEALTPPKDIPKPTFRGIAREKIKIDGPQKKLEFDMNIPFGLNQYQISEKALPYLQRLGNALSDSRLKNSIFEIQGHTCNLGTEDYNLWLSQKRAEAVKYYLVRRYGLSLNQLKTVGYGPQKPKWRNSSEKGRAKNRRVTIRNTLLNYDKNISRPYLNIAAKYHRAGKIEKLLPGTALSPRDNYFLTFTPDHACYVYIFQFDSHNSVTQLFPNPDFSRESNPVVSGKNHRVPGSERGWLFLDENQGKEELVVMAYPEPLPDPLKVALSLIGHYDSELFPVPNNEKKTATRGPTGVRETSGDILFMSKNKSSDDILFVWRNKFRHID